MTPALEPAPTKSLTRLTASTMVLPTSTHHAHPRSLLQRFSTCMREHTCLRDSSSAFCSFAGATQRGCRRPALAVHCAGPCANELACVRMRTECCRGAAHFTLAESQRISHLADVGLHVLYCLYFPAVVLPMAANFVGPQPARILSAVGSTNRLSAVVLVSNRYGSAAVFGLSNQRSNSLHIRPRSTASQRA